MLGCLDFWLYDTNGTLAPFLTSIKLFCFKKKQHKIKNMKLIFFEMEINIECIQILFRVLIDLIIKKCIHLINLKKKHFKAQILFS